MLPSRVPNLIRFFCAGENCSRTANAHCISVSFALTLTDWRRTHLLTIVQRSFAKIFNMDLCDSDNCSQKCTLYHITRKA